MTAPTEREWRRAQERGIAARQAGKPITACPDYGSGEQARTLAEAWQDAWLDEDQRRAGR